MSFNIINNCKSIGGNRGVLLAASELQASEQPFALALVVHTVGSTYRKSGALALYVNDECTKGVISGGCFESNWHKIANEVLTSRRPKSIVLDTQADDDLVFGSGSGCRGTMQVLVIPVIAGISNPLYSAIMESNAAAKSLKLALLIDEEHCATGVAWGAERSYTFATTTDTLQSFKHETHGQHKVVLSDGDSALVSVFSISSPPHILLIGAGVESPNLINIAHSLGWYVTIVDHRQAQFASISGLADKVIMERPSKAMTAMGSQFDAALVMSHSAATDLEALQILATRGERYIGLLGPPARRDELLSQLTQSQRASLLPRLHAPMGLRLGGHGPEPLALSILSELQQFFSGVDR